MRKQLRTKMADFASKSMQKVEGAPGKSSLPAPAPTPPAVQAAMRKPTTSADELDTQPTDTKLATIVSDARGAAVETVDGTTTLRTTPVTQAEAPAPVPERIVQHIERVMAQSQRQMTISMGELGEVRISMQRLAMQNGGLQVVLEATDARTSQLLQSQLGQLNEALQQKGYSEAVIDVREADAESTGFNENQDDRAQDDAQEEQERREAELAARQRMAKSARNTTREGVVR